MARFEFRGSTNICATVDAADIIEAFEKAHALPATDWELVHLDPSDFEVVCPDCGETITEDDGCPCPKKE